jgi:hypothetical protein
MSIIAWIVLGLIAGFIGSKLVNKTGEGFFRDRVLPMQLQISDRLRKRPASGRSSAGRRRRTPGRTPAFAVRRSASLTARSYEPGARTSASA